MNNQVSEFKVTITAQNKHAVCWR